MDVAILRGRILATLDADADTRRGAELDLKTVSLPSKSRQGHLLTTSSRLRSILDSQMPL